LRGDKRCKEYTGNYMQHCNGETAVQEEEEEEEEEFVQ
jgi:hypothetical protein